MHYHCKHFLILKLNSFVIMYFYCNYQWYCLSGRGGTLEAEAGESEIQGLSGLHRETLSPEEKRITHILSFPVGRNSF